MDADGVGEWTEGGDDDDVNNDENGESGEKKMTMNDVQGAIADRIEAMRTLQENPEDDSAREKLDKAQEQLSNWSNNGGGSKLY